MTKRLVPVLGVVLIALVAVAAFILIRGSGSLPADTEGDAVAPQATGETYAEEVVPLLNRYQSWQEGPLAERTEVLNSKIEDGGGLSVFTYGNMLLLYLNARESATEDTATMDQLIDETIAPRLLPVYEQIADDGAELAATLDGIAPPDPVAADHDRIRRCIAFEVERSHTIAGILSGQSDASLAERPSDNPCVDVEASLAAVSAFADSSASQ